MRSSRRALAWAAGLLLILACGPPATQTMVSIPPPRGWEAALSEYRSARDRQFREDPETPLLAEDLASFEGLDYWPADPRRYLAGTMRFYEEPERFTIPTTAGSERPCAKVGWIGFEIDGQQVTLQVYQLLDSDPAGPPSLFLPFRDATAGAETYPGGRYLDLVGSAGGALLLDFNRAYNPSCAYGAPERFACPVTPPENRLAVRIEAGERGYRDPAGVGG